MAQEVVHPWIVAINAAPYLAASRNGYWISDPLNYYFLCCGAIFVSGIFCLSRSLDPEYLRISTSFSLRVYRLGLEWVAKHHRYPSIRPRMALLLFVKVCHDLANVACIWRLPGMVGQPSVDNIGATLWCLQFGLALIPAVPFGPWCLLLPR